MVKQWSIDHLYYSCLNILKNIETRINQLNHIIDGAKNAHENDTITRRRKNKIISNAEDTIE